MTGQRKRPGRPGLDPSGRPSAGLCLRLRADEFDAADRLAKQHRETVQDMIRRGLRRELADAAKR